MARAARTGRGIDPKSNGTKKAERSVLPKCVVHGWEMPFKIDSNLWECPEEDCVMVALPKRDAPKGVPVIGKGEVHLLLQKDSVGSTHYYVQTEDMVMVDITDAVVDRTTKKRDDGLWDISLTVQFPAVSEPST